MPAIRFVFAIACLLVALGSITTQVWAQSASPGGRFSDQRVKDEERKKLTEEQEKAILEEHLGPPPRTQQVTPGAPKPLGGDKAPGPVVKPLDLTGFLPGSPTSPKPASPPPDAQTEGDSAQEGTGGLWSILSDNGKAKFEQLVLDSLRDDIGARADQYAFTKREAEMMLDTESAREPVRAAVITRTNSYTEIAFWVANAVLGFALMLTMLEYIRSANLRSRAGELEKVAVEKQRAIVGAIQSGNIAAIQAVASLESAARSTTETSPEELSITLEGIAVKSTRQGTIILAVALALYFLFVRFMYPVTVVP